MLYINSYYLFNLPCKKKNKEHKNVFVMSEELYCLRLYFEVINSKRVLSSNVNITNLFARISSETLTIPNR